MPILDIERVLPGGAEPALAGLAAALADAPAVGRQAFGGTLIR